MRTTIAFCFSRLFTGCISHRRPRDLAPKRKSALILVCQAVLFLAPLIASAQPIFLSQPQSQSVSLGVDIILYAQAYGPAPVSYQWRKNGEPIPGATMEILILSPLQASDAGDYDVVATDLTGSVTSELATITIDPTFTKITSGPVVSGVGVARGAAWADYDNDGFLDLFVAHDGGVNNALFHNDGDGTFTQLTNGPVVNDGGDSFGGAWGDANNDGWLDLFVANFNNQHDFLYLNTGTGSFDKVTYQLVVLDGRSTLGAAWADADNDGALDLLTANFPVLAFPNFAPGLTILYQNRGDADFVRVSDPPGSEDGGNIMATFYTTPSWADFDNDGRLDLFLGRYYNQPSSLHRNLGSNQFARLPGSALVGSSANAAGGIWGDYNNDGWLDLLAVNGFEGNAQPSVLYRNDGGTFTRMAEDVLPALSAQSWGGAWGDYDNDGFLDLFITDAGGDNALYRNRGDGTFAAIAVGSPVHDGGVSFGCSWADYDNDGFLDLVVANDDQSNFLYRNNGNSNAWLTVKCLGHSSNRAGLGAKVRVLAAIGGTNLWQVREITGGMSFGTQPLLAHFGLGDATLAETVKVEWPSGIVQELHGVAGRQSLTIEEPPYRITPPDPGAALGQDFTLSVAEAGDPLLQFQWRFHEVDIAEATNATLVLHQVTADDLGPYSVVVRDAAGAFSVRLPPVMLRTAFPATFLVQPQPTNQWVSLGASLTFSATVTGTGPLSLQWQLDGEDIPGATNSTLVLTNIQPAQAGTYTLVASNLAGMVTSQALLVGVDPSFIKIMTGSVVEEGGSSYGAGWVDFADASLGGLFVANSRDEDNFLYRIQGDCSFSRILLPDPGTIVSDAGDSIGVAVGDYDNDGRPDVFVATINSQTNALYRNTGGGTFVKVTNNLVATTAATSYSGAWADYDGDGALDLFVAASPRALLYRNNGDGTFASVTDTVVTTLTGTFRGCAWADYDNDGDPDLFVGNANQINLLFRNEGNGVFVRMTNSLPERAVAWGAAWGDYDNDGDLDLFMAANDNGYLYRNNGDGSLTRVIDPVLSTRGGQARGCAWADYDNDGDLDLFAAHSSGANFLFQNNGDGTFTRVTTGSIAGEPVGGKGCVWGDFDDNGFPDLFVATYVGNNCLYRNAGNSNHWLKVKCVGTRSNRSAIGAKVRVQAVIGGGPRWQMREITSGDGLGSQGLVAMFGLGDAAAAQTVRIQWPSGQVQELQNVAADRSLTITEPLLQPQLRALRLADRQFQFEVAGPPGAACTVQTSTNLHDWSPWQTITNDSAPQTLICPAPADVPQLYFRAVMP